VADRKAREWELLMQRQQLKSKIHRAVITRADPDYEGSIEIPADLMRAVDLWEREKVLVASITGGARLETYVQTGVEGSGEIVMNGGAAHLIGKGERVTIMAFTWSDSPVPARIAVCNEENAVIRREPPAEGDA
jgi:aspartate 1-decarboxylase